MGAVFEPVLVLGLSLAEDPDSRRWVFVFRTRFVEVWRLFDTFRSVSQRRRRYSQVEHALAGSLCTRPRVGIPRTPLRCLTPFIATASPYDRCMFCEPVRVSGKTSRKQAYAFDFQGFARPRITVHRQSFSISLADVRSNGMVFPACCRVV